MATGTMTSKGQITIPKEVREQLGLTPGTTVTFTRNPDGTYSLGTGHEPLMNLKGRLRHTGRPLTQAEMDEAIATSAAGDA